MAKCGKGCMPECEYFTTGGCISPFNCMYKEESGYINSATSGTVIYTGGMNMPDEKMIENLKCVIADISEQCELLKAENAALRERLSKAVELPCKIGDTVYGIGFTDCDDRTETDPKIKKKIFNTCLIMGGHCEKCKYGHMAIEEFVCTHIQIGENGIMGSNVLVVGEKNENYHSENVFTTREAAEARLAELKGGKG